MLLVYFVLLIETVVIIFCNFDVKVEHILVDNAFRFYTSSVIAFGPTWVRCETVNQRLSGGINSLSSFSKNIGNLRPYMHNTVDNMKCTPSSTTSPL